MLIQAVKRQTSMRGRLAILLILLMVVPIATVGLLGYRSMSDVGIDDGAPSDAGAISLGTAYRLNQEVEGFRRCLELSHAELAARTSALAAGQGAELDLAFAFTGVPSLLHPLVVRIDSAGRSVPELPATVVAHLLAWTRDGRPHAGFLSLSLGRDDATDGAVAALAPRTDLRPADTAGRICQVAVHPTDGGGAIVAIRDLAAPAGAMLLDTLPYGEHVMRLLVGLGGAPVSVARGSFSELARRNTSVWAATDTSRSRGEGQAPDEHFWRAALEESGSRPSHQDRFGDLLVAAIPLSDLSGTPIAFAVVEGTEHDFNPSLERHQVLRSEVLALVGWIAVIGVLTAVLMGLLAPRWIWRDIRDSTDGIFRSVERLRELVRRNSRALEEQSRVIESLMTSVVALDRDSKSIAETTRGLAESAESSRRVSKAGDEKAQTAQRTVEALRDRAEGLARQSEELDRRCAAIWGILGFIDHLSNETNTLSINATIQAAGAGGSGRQFTLVAAEIRKLADMALDSTRDIQQVVEQIQESSRTTLDASQESCREVDKCLTSFRELQESFERILRWVEETTQSAHGIEGSTARQSGSLQDVSHSLEALEQRARETSGNFRDVVDAADELAELGSRMNETWRVG